METADYGRGPGQLRGVYCRPARHNSATFAGASGATLLRRETVSPPGCGAGGTLTPCVLWVDPGVQGSRQEVEPSLGRQAAVSLPSQPGPFFPSLKSKASRVWCFLENLFALH